MHAIYPTSQERFYNSLLREALNSRSTMLIAIKIKRIQKKEYMVLAIKGLRGV